MFKHEFTHWLQQSAGHDAFADFAMKQMEGKSATKFERLKKIKEDELTSLGEPFDDSDVRYEMVADYVQERMFADAKSIKALVQANGGLAGRFLNKIQYAIAKGKLRKSGTPEAKAMLEAERLYVKAFRDAGIKPNGEKKAEAGDRVEYASSRKKAAPHYDVDNVTREQYDTYAWAIEHGDITPEEYGRFFAALGEIAHGNKELQNPDGVFVVMSYDKSKKPLLLIGTDGNVQNPSTEFVVRINETATSEEAERIWRAYKENGYEQASILARSSVDESSFASSSRRDVQSYEEFYSDRREQFKGSGRGNGRADAQDTSEQRVGISGAAGASRDQPGIPAGSETAVKEGIADGYQRFSNDVNYGVPPILVSETRNEGTVAHGVAGDDGQIGRSGNPMVEGAESGERSGAEATAAATAGITEAAPAEGASSLPGAAGQTWEELLSGDAAQSGKPARKRRSSLDNAERDALWAAWENDAADDSTPPPGAAHPILFYYTIPRTNGELQLGRSSDQALERYTIPRITGKLQLCSVIHELHPHLSLLTMPSVPTLLSYIFTLRLVYHTSCP